MAKLYEIVGELQEFIDMNEGLEDEEAYKDTLEALHGELNDKVSQWARAIKNIEAERDSIKAEADRLDQKQEVLDHKATNMKATLLMYLKAAGVKKAGDAVIGASVVKNGGLAPLVIDVDAHDLPERFQKVTIEADKQTIRDALSKGEELNFAHLEERGEHIKIG